MLRRVLLLLVLLASPALSQPLPVAKPPPLGAPTQSGQTGGGSAGPTCIAPLANACLTQQSACQVACPGMWSTNPTAPAFTPTDRAGCMRRCFNEHLACRRRNGC